MADVALEPNQVVFNHVGVCVTDVSRSRAFYEEVLGFVFWWELDAPEETGSKLLQLPKPLGLHAVYLIKDGFVLELLAYHPDRVEPWRKRTMAEPGLTHISVSVGDIDGVAERARRFGGDVVEETRMPGAVMIRDPDGQLIELLTADWLAALPPRPA
jgi:lactoylglutathione lyase